MEGSSEREQNQAPLRSSLSKKGPRRPRWIELRGCGAQEHLWLWDVGEQEFGRKLQITGIFFHSTNRVRNTESFPPHPWVWAGGKLDLVPGSQGANMTVPATRPARPPQAPKRPDAPAAPARALPTSVPTPAPCHSLPSGSSPGLGLSPAIPKVLGSSRRFQVRWHATVADGMQGPAGGFHSSWQASNGVFASAGSHKPQPDGTAHSRSSHLPGRYCTGRRANRGRGRGRGRGTLPGLCTTSSSGSTDVC